MMKKIIALTGIFFFAIWGQAVAGEKATPQKVFNKVVEAVECFKNLGPEATMKEVSNPKGAFVDGEIYVLVADCELGLTTAHPMAPHLVENKVDMRKITGKKGAPFFEQLCKLADNKMGGWAAYWWPKPGEKTPSRKLSFGMKIEIKGKKYMIVSGIYDENTSVEELNKLLK